VKKYLLPIALLLTSCSFFVSKIDESDTQKSANPKKFSVLFSHNISGETHPCGCRNFPLGGLPQVAGLFANISIDSETLYVDTGDTFFPSSVIPKTMEDSLSFAARNLALGLDQVGLKYFVPGDQDFAMGIEFLREIANARQFQFLISNLADENLIKHQRFAVVDRGQSKIFLVGLVDPEAFNGPVADYFVTPKLALPKVIDEIKTAGYEKGNPYHRLIVLSHAGIDPDELLAKEFPFIDWIIGAHSQSFLRFSKDVENVKMVQTLSKNHYVGDIQIDLNSEKKTDTYVLHEVRDELEKNLSPNPMRSFIDDHKTKMNDLQIKEQSKMGMDPAALHKELNANVKKFKTAGTCIECHKAQGDFWMATPHSIAYTTLININEANNLSCVGCHSLGLADPKGFSSQKDMVTFKTKSPLQYWNEVKKLGSHIESVRKLPSAEIKKTSVQWFALDKKAHVKENFANVQCLNCHTQADTHPMKNDTVADSAAHTGMMKNKCLSCHTPDQSPEWYDSGIKVNAKFTESYQKVSCPKL
jgi:Cytochrome c554 and c-prime